VAGFDAARPSGSMRCEERPTVRGRALLVLLGWLASLAACAAPGAAQRPPALLHLVYFRLVDGADAEALAADCVALLQPIPSVREFAVGRHLDTGRSQVVGDYDLLLFVGFDDERGYQEYLEHPDHLLLVERWGSRLAGYTVHDALDLQPR